MLLQNKILTVKRTLEQIEKASTQPGGIDYIRDVLIPHIEFDIGDLKKIVDRML
jgi:hypothetical protein